MSELKVELEGEYYKYYLESIQKKLGNPHSLHGAHHRNLNRFIQQAIDALPGIPKVLDAGCGLSIWVTEEILNTTEYHGLDCQKESIEFCKTAYPGRFYTCGDLYEVPFDDDTFDAVVMREVIEHFKYPERAVREVARVLRPDGVFVLTTPNYGNPLLYIIEHIYNRFFGGPCKPYLPDVHPSRFRKSSLKSLLEEYFEIVDLGDVSLRINLTAISRGVSSKVVGQ